MIRETLLENSAAKSQTTFSPSRILTDFSSSNVTHTISSYRKHCEFIFLRLDSSPDNDDALKLLDPLAATLQIGDRMDVRPNGDENRTMKAFTAIGQLWRMIMLGSSQKGRRGGA
jgi:hypothetical protein